MSIEFKKEYLNKRPVDVSKLTGYFPTFFFFCDDEGKVIDFDMGVNGSIREVADSVTNYCERYAYSPLYLSKFSIEPIKSGAVLVIAGYYDLFKEEFIEISRAPIETSEAGAMAIESVRDLANKVFPKMHNASFFSRELMDMNIKSSDEVSLFKIGMFDEGENLKNLSLWDLYQDIRCFLDKESKGEFYLDKNISRESLDKLNINNIKLFSKEDGNALGEKYKFTPMQLFAVANILRVYDIFDLIVIDKNGEVDNYTSLSKFSPEDIIENAENYRMAIAYSKRLIETQR